MTLMQCIWLRYTAATAVELLGKKVIAITYDELCDFGVLYDAYKSARKCKRHKESEARYESHILECTARLKYLLKSRTYKPQKFNTFYVYEPKVRLVQAPAFVDKVVQHALVDNVLYEAITKSFIYDNYASQIGKGFHLAQKRLKRAMLSYFRTRKGRDEEVRRAEGIPYKPMKEWDYADGWVLKCDVRKFFASIDHDIAKEKLRKKVEDDDIYNLMCTYIDTTDGLPLGYQTSQLLALLYLDEFDHFVKEKLRVKYYGRYMDDFYLIHEDKEYLKYCLKEIRKFMVGLKLELNEKTAIFPLRNGIDFCGFHTYLTETGKVITKLRSSSKQKMNRRIKKWRKAFEAGDMDKEQITAGFMGWHGHVMHGDTHELIGKYKKRVEGIIQEEIKL